MRKEFDDTFKNDVIMRMPRSTLDLNCEIRSLEWGLQIKRNLGDPSNVRYRASLVSTFDVSHLKHSIA